jgi:hypothetical protein
MISRCALSVTIAAARVTVMQAIYETAQPITGTNHEMAIAKCGLRKERETSRLSAWPGSWSLGDALILIKSRREYAPMVKS